MDGRGRGAGERAVISWKDDDIESDAFEESLSARPVDEVEPQQGCLPCCSSRQLEEDDGLMSPPAKRSNSVAALLVRCRSAFLGAPRRVSLRPATAPPRAEHGQEAGREDGSQDCARHRCHGRIDAAATALPGASGGAGPVGQGEGLRQVPLDEPLARGLRGAVLLRAAVGAAQLAPSHGEEGRR